MKLRRLIIALGMFLGAAYWFGLSLSKITAADGGQKPSQSVPATAPGIVKAEANLVVVDVVVTDKKGNPVQDLEQKDFRLYEDDKEQTITSFSRTSASDPQGPTQPHYLTLFFDNSTMAASDQMQVRKDAAEFLKKTAGKDRLAAVLDFTGSLRVTQNFTTDGDLLQAAVAGVKSMGLLPNAGGQSAMFASLQGPKSVGQVRADFGARSVLMALRSAVKDLSSVSGRKVLILFSSGFELTPNRQPELSAAIDAANKANVAIYAVDVRGLKGNQPGFDTRLPGSAFGPGATLQESPFPHLRALHASLLWLLSPDPQARGGGGTGGAGGGTGGTGGGTGGAGGGAGAGGAAPGGSTGGTTSSPGTSGGSRGGPGMGGGGGNNPNGPASTFGRGQTRDALQQMNIPRLESTTTNQQVLYALAAGTGGFTVFNCNSFGPELARVERDLHEYYVLGYVPPNPTYDGRYHSIRAKLVERKGVTVRSRNGYFDTKSPDMLAGKPEGKQLEDRGASPQPSDFPVALRAVHFYSSANVARVNLALDIPPKTLEVEKVKGKLHTEMNILGIAYREDGSVAARFSDAVKLDFERSDWQQASKIPFSYYNNFNIAPGKYLLRLVLRTGAEKFGKYEVPLTIEPYNGQQFALSALALSNQFRPVSQLTAGLDSALMEERTPLVAGGMELTLAAENRFKRSDEVGFYVEVYEPKMLTPKPPALGVIMSVVDRKTNQEVFNSNTIRVNDMSQPGNPVVPVLLAIPVKNLQAGDYRLEVQARDGAGSVSTLRTTEFTLEEPTQ